jgi:hypothetical protein
MPSYTIEYAFGRDSSDYPTRMAAIRNILERWEDDEVNCAGIMTFLKNNGYDFDGLADDDLAGISKDMRLKIGDAVRSLCSSGKGETSDEAMQLEFIGELSLIDVCETMPCYVVEYEGDVLGDGGTLIETIEEIMLMWATGDLDARGTLTFLRAKGVSDFNDLTEDDIDEGAEFDLLREIGAAVIKICKDGGILVQEEFVVALENVTVVRVQ